MGDIVDQHPDIQRIDRQIQQAEARLESLKEQRIKRSVEIKHQHQNVLPEMSVRLRTACQNADISTIEDLEAAIIRGDLRKLPNCGKKTLHEARCLVWAHTFRRPTEARAKRIPRGKPKWRERAPEIKRLRGDGVSFAEIGRFFGVSGKTVASNLACYERSVRNLRRRKKWAREFRKPAYHKPDKQKVLCSISPEQQREKARAILANGIEKDRERFLDPDSLEEALGQHCKALRYCRLTEQEIAEILVEMLDAENSTVVTGGRK